MPRNCFWLISFVFLFVYVCVNFIIIAADDAEQIVWDKVSIDTVDSGSYVHYSYTDISLDAQGHSHICYRGEDQDLRYATNSVDDWSTEVVMDLAIGVARECAIALDADGLPHISFSYDDGSGENLYYAYKDAVGEWHQELVVGVVNNSLGMENDIAIDENGRIHISHWEWSGSNLLYSFKENGAWVTEQLVDGGVAWDKTAIAVDSQQKAHIFYGTGSQILHITGQLNNWSEPEFVASCPGSACGPALAIDSQGNLHVTFSLANELQYGTNKSGVWDIQTVATDVAVAEHHAIAVNQNNYVHISYFDAVNPGLYYANNVSGKWSTFTVESEGEIGRSNAIAVGQDNHVKISYRNDFDGASINQPELKYAETIDPIGSTSDPLQIYLPIIVKE